jgi:Zn finger protein HypA/HybF involved in hydrogenase expression
MMPQMNTDNETTQQQKTINIVTVRVTCPKCQTEYTDRYLPGLALPEVMGFEQQYADDCVVTSCPACNHLMTGLSTGTILRVTSYLNPAIVQFMPRSAVIRIPYAPPRPGRKLNRFISR